MDISLLAQVAGWNWRDYGLIGLVVGAQFVYQFVKDRRSSNDMIKVFDQVLKQADANATRLERITGEFMEVLGEVKSALAEHNTLLSKLNGNTSPPGATD